VRPMRFSLAMALSAAALTLGGCGFTPLYATEGAGGSLASIDVATPNNRSGFLLKQSLQDQLAPKAGEAPRYRLECTVVEHRVPRGVRVNNVANRYEINMTVSYTLTENASGKVVVKGTAPVIVTYDSADPPYAGTVAAQDGDQRASEQAAIQIRLALGRFFAGRPLGAPGLVQTPVPNRPTDETP